MALHPQIVELMRRAEEAGIRPNHELTPVEAREQMEVTSKVR
ncbi:MAG: alpha/beta hydrolase, partial [Alphaproteobacteria bacterium]|nr:alpha/beta hydrolase [Alphaproteobacteria bacterium]